MGVNFEIKELTEEEKNYFRKIKIDFLKKIVGVVEVLEDYDSCPIYRKKIKNIFDWYYKKTGERKFDFISQEATEINIYNIQNVTECWGNREYCYNEIWQEINALQK